MVNRNNSVVTPDQEVIITRDFNIPRSQVWNAWTQPDHAVHWYGPTGFTTPICEMDVRPGGAFRICMRSPSGSECWERGTFSEVVAPERLVSIYTATLDQFPGVELKTTLTLDEQAGTTHLIVRQTFFDTTFTRGAEEGLNQALDRLTRYLNQNQNSISAL